MGTRSLTIVKDGEGKKDLLTIYRQFDGYLSGHGKDLKNFLASRVLVNGLGRHDEKIEANGMGCLAAQLVSILKTGGEGERINPGGIYIYPNGSHDVGEEYIYIISPRGASFDLKIYTLGDGPDYKCNRLIYNGAASDFDPEMEK
jgi:hypothetical protein